jgi:hypothetical protein
MHVFHHRQNGVTRYARNNLGQVKGVWGKSCRNPRIQCGRPRRLPDFCGNPVTVTND